MALNRTNLELAADCVHDARPFPEHPAVFSTSLSTAAMNWSHFFLNPAVVWVLIPVSVIVIGGVTEIYKRYCKHQERIAMIENGMHPDGPHSSTGD